jgi:hypothetical protein
VQEEGTIEPQAVARTYPHWRVAVSADLVSSSGRWSGSARRRTSASSHAARRQTDLMGHHDVARFVVRSTGGMRVENCHSVQSSFYSPSLTIGAHNRRPKLPPTTRQSARTAP